MSLSKNAFYLFHLQCKSYRLIASLLCILNVFLLIYTIELASKSVHTLPMLCEYNKPVVD